MIGVARAWWLPVALPCLALADMPLYDVGDDWQRLGTLAAGRIAGYFAASPTTAQLRTAMRNSNVSAAFDSLLSWHSAAFPRFADELRGMALGSGVPFQDLAMYSFKNELLTLYGTLGQQAPVYYEEDACSDVAVHDSAAHLHGHNEDGEKELSNFSYMVKTSDFEALTYPGSLAGGTFAFNRHGVVVTMNALSPKDVVIQPGCVGKYWLGRAVLEAESVEEAISIIGGHCHAYGMSLNIASAKTYEQVNVEIGPGSKFSVHNITNGSYFHANAYLHLDVAEDPHLSPSSAHREARARQLMPAASRNDILRILGDTQDAHWPIYRTLGDGDYSVTLATAVFDLDSLKVDIWDGSNPKLVQPVLSRSLLGRPEVSVVV